MNKKTHANLTLILCAIWLLATTTLGAVMIGAAVHELSHQENAIGPSVSFVSWDGTGKTISEGFVTHNHDWVYLRGNLALVFVLMLNFISMAVLLSKK